MMLWYDYSGSRNNDYNNNNNKKKNEMMEWKLMLSINFAQNSETPVTP